MSGASSSVAVAGSARRMERAKGFVRGGDLGPRGQMR